MRCANSGKEIEQDHLSLSFSHCRGHCGNGNGNSSGDNEDDNHPMMMPLIAVQHDKRDMKNVTNVSGRMS